MSNPNHFWEYRTVSPKPTRINEWDVDLPPGHRYGYKCRTDRFHPKTRHYKFYCVCGWRTEHWWASRPMAARMAEKFHTMPLMKQGRLF